VKGIVIWFNEKRGYGFIRPEDKSKDVFVHYTGIASEDKFKQLKQNQQVEFDLFDNEKGRTAINVKVIGDQVKVSV